MPKLSIDLEARFAQFQQSLNRVEADTNRITRSMDASFGRLSRTIGTLGVGLSFSAITGQIAQVANELDTLGKTAQGIGLSTEALSTLRFAAERSGVEISAMESAVAKLNRRLVEAKRGTGEAAKTFADLGVDVTNLETAEDVIRAVADRFQQLPDGVQKTTAALRLFEETGFRFVNLLSSGSAGLDAFRREAEDLGRVFSSEATRNAAEFNDQLNRFSQEIRGLRDTIGTGIIADLNKFFATFRALRAGNEGVIGFLKSLEQATGTLPTLFADGVPGADLVQEDLARARDEATKTAAEVERLTSQLNSADADSGWARILERDLAKAQEAAEEASRELSNMQKLFNQLALNGNDIDLSFNVVGTDTAEKAVDAVVTATKARVSEGQRLIQSLQAQIRATQDLTEVERGLQTIRDNGGTVTDGELRRINQLGEILKVNQDLIASEQERVQEAQRAQAEFDELARAQANLLLENERFAQQQELSEKLGLQRAADDIKNLIDPMRSVNAEIDKVLRVQQAGLISKDEAAVAIAHYQSISRSVQDIGDQATETDKILERMVGRTAGAFTEAIFEAESFSDVLKQLAIDFAKLIVQQQLFKALNFALGGGAQGSLVQFPAFGDTPGTTAPGFDVPFGGSSLKGGDTYNITVPAGVSTVQMESAIRSGMKGVRNEIADNRLRGGAFA